MTGAGHDHRWPALVAAADASVGERALKAAPERRCFAAATMILMADGGEVPIERVAVGATVVGRHGRADPATPLYSLLLDGDHTYVASGYLVHGNVDGDHGNTSRAVRARSPGNLGRRSRLHLRKPGIS